MKIKNLISLSCLLIFCAMFFTNCERDGLDNDLSNVDMDQLVVKKTTSEEYLDNAFALLNAQENFNDLSISDQFAILDNQARENNFEFDLQNSINYYEGQTNNDFTTAEEEFIQRHFDAINNKINEVGITYSLQSEMVAYRNKIVDSGYEAGIGTEAYNVVLEHTFDVEYISTSEVFQTYIEKTKVKYATVDGSITERGDAECILAIALLALKIAKCSSGNIFACAGIPGAIIKVAKECGSDGGGPTGNPCDNSPNPCCGVHCASGYVMAANCDCVPDPNGCHVLGCPPDYSCIGGECIPH